MEIEEYHIKRQELDSMDINKEPEIYIETEYKMLTELDKLYTKLKKFI